MGSRNETNPSLWVGTTREAPRFHELHSDIDTDVVASLDLGARNVTRHPRSPRLAHVARALKRRGERLNLLPSPAYQLLRRAYFRLNSGNLSESLDPALRRHVQDIYQESNEITARTLAAHGYRDLPAWLAPGRSE